MMEATFTRRDRILGLALLASAVLIGLLPDFQLGGQTVRPHLIGVPWFGAAVLLLTSDAAARPSPVLIRRLAAIFFVGGFITPFFANFIDSSLGA